MGLNSMIEFEDITKEKLLEECSKGKRVFIYGAGRWGLTVFYGLQEDGIIPFSFVVSTKNLGKYEAIDMTILEYSETSFEKDDLLIVAVTSQYRDEIMKGIQQVTCRVLIIPDEYYNKYYPIYAECVENVLREIGWTYYRNVEKPHYEQQFNDIDFHNESFIEKWRKLARNLDEKSINNLKMCLDRMKKIKQDDRELIDIFTGEEKEKRRKYCKDLNDNIIEHDDGIWEYRGKFLPCKDFREEIFIEKLGIENVVNIKQCENKDILDVGAYIGDSALILSEYTKGMVHAFDLVHEHIEMIRKTAYLNKANIKAIELALGAEDGEKEYFVGEKEYISGLKKLESIEYSSSQKITIGTIDSYVEKYKLNVGVIKIHAEGCEQEIIKGAMKTIKEQSPILIIEMHHTESDFWSIKPMIESINSNYNYTVFKACNGLVMHGLKLIAEVL